MNDKKYNGNDTGHNKWVKNSRLFQEWDRIKNEILMHKWYESEKAGHDIGWERASVDWLIRFGHQHK